MKKREVFFFFLFCLLPFLTLQSEEPSEENIRITTYYPSPYGSYQQLRSKVLQLEATEGPPSLVSGKEESGMLYFDKEKGLQYYDESAHKWQPISSTGGLGLINSIHTQSDCTNAGGEVVDTDTGFKQCRFNRSSCLSGWTQYKNYSTTVNETTPHTVKCGTHCYLNSTGKFCACGKYCSATSMGCGFYTRTSCTPGSHAWGNAARESCTTCDQCCGMTGCPYPAQISYATITQTGCY